MNFKTIRFSSFFKSVFVGFPVWLCQVVSWPLKAISRKIFGDKGLNTLRYGKSSGPIDTDETKKEVEEPIQSLDFVGVMGVVERNELLAFYSIKEISYGIVGCLERNDVSAAELLATHLVIRPDATIKELVEIYNNDGNGGFIKKAMDNAGLGKRLNKYSPADLRKELGFWDSLSPIA